MRPLVEVVMGLSQHAGQTAIQRFCLAGDNGASGAGWYIDGVRVTGAGL